MKVIVFYKIYGETHLDLSDDFDPQEHDYLDFAEDALAKLSRNKILDGIDLGFGIEITSIIDKKGQEVYGL